MKNLWQDIKWLLNYMASVFMYAIIVILILIGILLFLYFIDIKKNANSPEWKPPLYGAYVIVSGSMETTIMQKDAIIIKRFDKSKIKVNDIITYRSENPYYYGIMITHRIIGIEKNNGEILYVTKGDNNNTADPLKVKASQIYGKVVMVIPKIGYLQAFLATSYGWLLAIVLPCVGIVAYDIVKLIKSFGKENYNSKRKEEIKL